MAPNATGDAVAAGSAPVMNQRRRAAVRHLSPTRTPLCQRLPVQRYEHDAAGASEQERGDAAARVLDQPDAAQPQLRHKQVEQADERNVEADPPDEPRVPQRPSFDPVPREHAQPGTGGVAEDVDRSRIAAPRKSCEVSISRLHTAAIQTTRRRPGDPLVRPRPGTRGAGIAAMLATMSAGTSVQRHAEAPCREVERAQRDDGGDEHEVAEQGEGEPRACRARRRWPESAIDRIGVAGQAGEQARPRPAR
jgi:hypothetical protein